METSVDNTRGPAEALEMYGAMVVVFGLALLVAVAVKGCA